jgi:uncharacterized protein YqjF (DUF2071 family)
MRVRPTPKVAVPVMHHRWAHITFLHWRYPAETLRAMVPGGLEVETFDGSAWVGMTPFLMDDVRPPGVPALPWLSRFPETNVRTYVRDGRGRSGIWFFSLDAGRLTAALGGRAGYWLPYFWSDMSVHIDGTRWWYRSRRHLSGRPGARGDVRVEVGAELTGPARDDLASFLTDRYRLFTVVAGRLAAAEVEHAPWPLHEARLCGLDQTLLHAAGLPTPGADPVVHASPGVDVRVGWWSR